MYHRSEYIYGLNFNAIPPNVPEIKALDTQTDRRTGFLFFLTNKQIRNPKNRASLDSFSFTFSIEHTITSTKYLANIDHRPVIVHAK